jgi:hypothetical protein
MASIERIFLNKSSANIFPATVVRVIGLLSKVTSNIDFTNSSSLVRNTEDSSSDNK